MSLQRVKIFLMVFVIQSIVFAQVEVTLPDTVITGTGGSGYLPITVSNVPEAGITNFNLWISYDNSVINITDAEQEGTLIEDWASLSSFTHGDNQFRIGGLSGGSGTVTSSGTLVKIYVEYIDTGTTDLTWDYCFIANDKVVNSSPVDGSITVQGNQEPVFQNTRLDTTIKEKQVLEYNFTAEDPEGEDVQYGLLDAPSGASINSNDGVFSWEPGYDDSGDYEFVVEASDGVMFSQDSVFISVLDSNRAPVFINSIEDTTINENEEVSFSYTASDPDGDPLTFAAVSIPEGAVFTVEDTTLTWTPTYSQSGEYTVVVSVTDQMAIVNDTTFVTVTNVNRGPAFDVVLPDTTIAENTDLAFTYTATDPDADELTFSLVGAPEGAAIGGSSGAFTWTPTYEQAGSYDIVAVVSDGFLTDTSSAVVTVGQVNRVPVFVDVMPDTTIDEGQALSYTYTATDADADVLAYSLVDAPDGAAIDGSSGAFTWTPTYEQAGSYTIVVSVTDGTTAVSNTAVVTVNDVEVPVELANIAEAKVDADVNFVPDLLGTLVTVGGIVTTPNFGSSTDYFIQDQTGGICLYSSDIAADLNIGDSVSVTGRIDQYGGKTEIVPDATTGVISVISTGHSLPDAYEVADDEEIGEDLEGRLIKIRYALIVDPSSWPSEGSNGNVEITYGAFTFIMRIDKDTDLDGWTSPTSYIEIVGVVDQYTSSVPPNDGYQIKPRYIADINAEVGVDKELMGIPEKYEISQNYPNPFNPMTTIKYELPKESFVRIAIYDLMGHKVHDLVNQNQNAGYQTVIWNATDNYGRKVSSGYYIYIMDMEGFHKTQKMILLK